MTPVAATSQTAAAPSRADLPFAVPGRRTHAADFAGGAGIVGQWFVVDIGRQHRAVYRANPEVRAPGRLDLFSDRNGTFSS